MEDTLFPIVLTVIYSSFLLWLFYVPEESQVSASVPDNTAKTVVQDIPVEPVVAQAPDAKLVHTSSNILQFPSVKVGSTETELKALNVAELRNHCSRLGIHWRNAMTTGKGNQKRHLRKDEMVTAIIVASQKSDHMIEEVTKTG